MRQIAGAFAEFLADALAGVPQLGDQTGLLISPEAVSNRTPRLIRRVMPSSWAISSRANRLASSTITVRTPLPSIRSLARGKPRPTRDVREEAR